MGPAKAKQKPNNGSLSGSTWIYFPSSVTKLTLPLPDMNATSLDFWLCKSVREVRNKDGEKYPQRTLYQTIIMLL
jgi:hypothetical protein